MYPTVSEFLKSIGIDLKLPIQTFGFFVALAFGVAAYLLGKELKRKQSEGLIQPQTRKRTVGAPANPMDYVYNAIGGFFIGYKLVYLISNYAVFADNPQAMLLSFEGSFLGGVLGAAMLAYWRYFEVKKTLLPQPKTIEEKVNAEDHLGNIIMLGVVGGILGAKLFHNLENPAEFFADPIGALFSFSGLTFYGGLIVAAFLIIRYGRKNGINAWHLCDAASPALMLSYGVGRLGCQLSGDGDWGIVNVAPKPSWMSGLPDWMWSFKFPHNVNNEGIPIPGCVGRWCHELPEPVFPTSFYEFLMAAVLFAILWSIRKRIQVPGLLFSIYLIMNGAERFLIEQIRVNSLYTFGSFQVTQAQIISSLLIIIGIFGVRYSINKAKISRA
ncbi:MAG: prolipoprotein diacylglyceryl transferase [Bacteroidia bacterium]|jgi:phosphatidylglycerol:prolipoprotein diacylglycerol transferase